MALTPMMKQYLKTKEEYSDCIVFYRLGDFYEMFFDDAVLVSKLLDLTLTGKDCGVEQRAPMCGIPAKSVETYIARLLKANLKVAICEQLTEPTKGGKEIVERDVVRVITPGTVIETGLLDARKNNFIMSIYKSGSDFGASYVDLSTGEFYLMDTLTNKKLIDELVTLSPSEIIANSEGEAFGNQLGLVELGIIPKFSSLENNYFLDNANFKNQFKELPKIDNKNYSLSLLSSNALISYLLSTQKRSLDFLNQITLKNDEQFMQLDSQARRNLEINETLNNRSFKGSLLWVIDNTKTGMGARKLKSVLNFPLQKEKDIKYRLNAVEELYKNLITRDQIVDSLSKIQDIERLSVKVCYGSATPKDCLGISNSLIQIDKLKELLSPFSSKALKDIEENLFSLKVLQDEISRCLVEDKFVLGSGECIKRGYDAEFDEYKDLAENASQIVRMLEETERERTGIKNLKIKFNKVFGYFIEVTKLNADLVPPHYMIKQNLSNAYRYTTEDLMELEKKILYANDNLIKIERRLFGGLLQQILERIKELKCNAKSVSMLDVLVSFAITATKYNYTKPIFNEKSDKIYIEQGRHPVVEALQRKEPFIPNDTILDSGENRTMVITGPNMAGKSTYMRQVALITILSHIGSFVPAKKCEMCLVDKIFTRIGASDDLTSNQSTFMVEMSEVSTIINNCTDRSLILLDEVGRGTSTFDGMSIASSVMEYLAKNIKAKTLFSTHYHELTNMEGVLDGVKNYRISVKEFQGNIIFLRKIARGGANKSFGIEVAAMAGLPKEVIARAKEIMNELLKEKLDTSSKMIVEEKPTQNYAEIINMLKEINLNVLTPLESFQILVDVCQKLKN